MYLRPILSFFRKGIRNDFQKAVCSILFTKKNISHLLFQKGIRCAWANKGEVIGERARQTFYLPPSPHPSLSSDGCRPRTIARNVCASYVCKECIIEALAAGAHSHNHFPLLKRPLRAEKGRRKGPFVDISFSLFCTEFGVQRTLDILQPKISLFLPSCCCCCSSSSPPPPPPLAASFIECLEYLIQNRALDLFCNI